VPSRRMYLGRGRQWGIDSRKTGGDRTDLARIFGQNHVLQTLWIHEGSAADYRAPNAADRIVNALHLTDQGAGGIDRGQWVYDLLLEVQNPLRDALNGGHGSADAAQQRTDHVLQRAIHRRKNPADSAQPTGNDADQAR